MVVGCSSSKEASENTMTVDPNKEVDAVITRMLVKKKHVYKLRQKVIQGSRELGFKCETVTDNVSNSTIGCFKYYSENLYHAIFVLHKRNVNQPEDVMEVYITGTTDKRDFNFVQLNDEELGNYKIFLSDIINKYLAKNQDG